MTDLDRPAERVEDFLRQRARMPHLNQQDIASVHSDSEVGIATLRADDLRALIAAARERDQLRAEVERLTGECDEMCTELRRWLPDDDMAGFHAIPIEVQPGDLRIELVHRGCEGDFRVTYWGLPQPDVPLPHIRNDAQRHLSERHATPAAEATPDEPTPSDPAPTDIPWGYQVHLPGECVGSHEPATGRPCIRAAGHDGDCCEARDRDLAVLAASPLSWAYKDGKRCPECSTAPMNAFRTRAAANAAAVANGVPRGKTISYDPAPDSASQANGGDH